MTAAIVVALIAAAFWISILRRWQRGIYLLLLYMPFAGVVTLSLYPASWPTLLKDLLFVIPMYVSYVFSRVMGRRDASLARVPRVIGAFVLTLAALVVLQGFNPGVANWIVAAIGMKVWLLYLPMIFAGSAILETRYDLVRILRLLAVTAWIPCLVGLGQWMGANAFGYQTAIEAFYGEAAGQATQYFTGEGFEVGSFFRIPSTFVFVTQYFGYTLAMISVAYALASMDPSKRWRRFAMITQGLAVAASLLSGARSAFLFVPVLLALTYLIDGRTKELLRAIVIAPPFLLLVFYAANINPLALYEMMRDLFVGYSSEIAYHGLLNAIQQAPFGAGTGMNTGPARYGFADPEAFVAIENFYAKTAYELGVIGLFVLTAFFIALIVHGRRSRRTLNDKGLRSCAAAILAFLITIMLNSFKGWQIDLDPVNVYFWLFAGFLLKLHSLERTPAVRQAGTTAKNTVDDERIRVRPPFRGRPLTRPGRQGAYGN